MEKLSFEKLKISEVHNIYGGGFATGSGKHWYGFCYDSDYSTWEPGAKKWKISYYGITPGENCPCYCDD